MSISDEQRRVAVMVGKMHLLSLEALAAGAFDTYGRSGPFRGPHSRAISRSVMVGLVDRDLACVRCVGRVGAKRTPRYVASITDRGRTVLDAKHGHGKAELGRREVDLS